MYDGDQVLSIFIINGGEVRSGVDDHGNLTYLYVRKGPDGNKWIYSKVIADGQLQEEKIYNPSGLVYINFMPKQPRPSWESIDGIFRYVWRNGGCSTLFCTSIFKGGLPSDWASSGGGDCLCPKCLTSSEVGNG